MRRDGVKSVIRLVSAMLLALSVLGCGTEFHEKFEGRSFDSRMFRADTNGSGGHWDLKRGALRGVLPGGSEGRPPLKFVGLFQLEGNFEVTLEYAIDQLPVPKSEAGWNNIEIYLHGPDGEASLYRNAQAGKLGQGLGAHFRPWTPGEVQGLDQRWPSDTPGGRLSLRRVGETLSFLGADGKSDLKEYQQCEFGRGPITNVAFQIVANQTTDSLEARFLRIDVKAGRVVGGQRRLSPRVSPWVWLPLTAAVAAGGLWGTRIWIGRRRLKAKDRAAVSS